MANFYGTARTNYFKVKDADAFKAWVEAVRQVAHEYAKEALDEHP